MTTLEAQHEVITNLILENQKLKQERDEAREALKTLAQHGESEIQRLIKERDEARELHKKSLREREAAEQESDATLERAHKAERERDEAREVANGLAKQAERLRKERDQLKEALLIMENLLKPGIELFPEIGEILKQGGAK